MVDPQNSATYLADLIRLVIAAEMASRRRRTSPDLELSSHGRLGLQVLAAAAADDLRWHDALRTVGFSTDDREAAEEAERLRDIRLRYDGIRLADLLAALNERT